MSRFLQTTLALLLIAAGPIAAWGQDEEDPLRGENSEGLLSSLPAAETVRELPPDQAGAISDDFFDPEVDAAVDAPIDFLFDSPVEDDNAGGAPGSIAPANGSGPRGSGPQPTTGTGLLSRPHLTGDWWGGRTALRKSGIHYRGPVTQFFFGVDGGIRPPVPPQLARFGIQGGDTFEYTGNSRHDLVFDLDKFGGPERGKFLVTLENIWGRYGNVSFETGAVTPTIFNAVQPVDNSASGSLYLTNFAFAQPLSENLIVSFGKSRLVAVADRNVLAGGDGSDQFLNQTFCMNPL